MTNAVENLSPVQERLQKLRAIHAENVAKLDQLRKALPELERNVFAGAVRINELEMLLKGAE